MGLGHRLDGLPVADDPALTGADPEDAEHRLLVDPRPLGQPQPFEGALEVDGQDDVVGDLGHFAHADAADVEHVAGHGVEDVVAAGQGGLVAADHDGQGARLGAVGPAADGSVEEPDARLGGKGGQRSTGGRMDRGMDDNRRPRSEGVQDAGFVDTDQCRLDLGVVDDGDQNDV